MHFEVPGVPEVPPLQEVSLPPASQGGTDQSCVPLAWHRSANSWSSVSLWAPLTFRKTAGNTPVQIGCQRSFWFRFPQSALGTITLGSSFLPFPGCAFPPLHLLSFLSALADHKHTLHGFSSHGWLHQFPLVLMWVSLGDWLKAAEAPACSLRWPSLSNITSWPSVLFTSSLRPITSARKTKIF